MSQCERERVLLDVGLVSTPLVHPDGGERQALHLAIELQKMGHQVTVYAPEADKTRCFPELIEKVDLRVLSPQGAWGAFGRFGRRAKMGSIGHAGIVSMAKRIGASHDLLNCHNYSSNWATYQAKKRSGKPAVWMSNDPPFWWYGKGRFPRWGRWPEGLFLHAVDLPAARAMDAVAVLDQNNVRLMREIYNIEPRLVRSGIDVEFFARASRENPRGELGLEGKFVMLLVGYASPLKGQQYAIEVLERILPSIPEAHLVLAGKSVLRVYEPVVAQKGLNKSVTLLEGLSDEKLAALYHAADVVLFPADQTWGLTVVEAMAAARPVVVSDKAGVSEVVSDGETGFVFHHGDVDRMEKVVRQLYADRALRAVLGRSAATFVSTNLSWPAYARSMLAIFDDVIAHPRERGPSARLREVA